mmetsp:Transcript_18672/g.52172  ORF Transcript_18672/g.52172 Transcript_18672/m.52172 type:complete len:135 (-) Transcript_18672:173-577(-)
MVDDVLVFDGGKENGNWSGRVETGDPLRDSGFHVFPFEPCNEQERLSKCMVDKEKANQCCCLASPSSNNVVSSSRMDDCSYYYPDHFCGSSYENTMTGRENWRPDVGLGTQLHVDCWNASYYQDLCLAFFVQQQ